MGNAVRAMTMDQTAEPIFTSAHEALKFAFSYSSYQYPMSVMAKMMKRRKPLGSGRGLVGLDGAAQAGFVLSEVGQQARLNKAIITARFLERSMVCECCGGLGRNPDWWGAICFLAEASAGAVSGVSHSRMRQDLLAKIYGEPFTLDQIATRFSLDRKTIARHRNALDAWSRKVEARAVGAIDERLRDIGMVGERAE